MMGTFREPDMRAAAVEMKRVTDEYQGRPHMILADLRGLTPFAPEMAEIMGARPRWT
jgi:hypothetical protein